MSEIHPERVAMRLQALREAVGLNRADFADSLHINRSSYTLIEDGRKPLNHRMGYDVAVRYGVTMDYLYRGSTSDKDLPDSLAHKIRALLMGHI
jgi:transcriptional regulator with XRE-family HTH domain